MAMADAAERRLWRGRRGRLLVGAVGLLFAAAVVREKQRVWERGQEPRPVSLGEDDYARELGAGGESPAQRLAALHRALARTSLQLQGSDRARSRAIRREETLAERPPQSPGFEQGASAEWAAGGATNLARRELATHRMLAGEGQGRASSVDEVLAQSAQALRRDIERQERNARGEQLAQAPGAPAARATPASAAPQPAAPLAAAAESQAWPQQLSQVWQGTGAVYAPSVMTSYQQQMLQSYMGAPTLASPPSVQSATPTSQLQGGTQQQQPRGDAPPTGLHGPALAAAWKAYLDPETAPAHSPAAAAPVSVSAPQPAPAAAYISELPAVGKAVENVAVDSDGVLEHAESLMSSVKKLLKKPEHDLTQAATQAATSARQAVAAAKESKGQTQRVTKVMTKEITKATKATKSLKSLIAAAKAEHSKLESERSHLLARQYKQLAASIPAPHRREGNKDSEQYETLRKELVTRIEGDVRALEQARVDTKGANKRIRAGLTDPARTESLAAVPVAPKEGQGSGKGENVSVAALSRSNASSASSHLHAVRGESKADKAVSGHVQPHVEAAAGLAKGTGSGLTALPQLPALPHVAGASLVGSAPAASASAVQPPADAQRARAVKLQEHSRGPQADKGGKSGRGAAEDAYTPVINVNIHDSKIDGGLRISRNTGERKGAGAQSGCGALCQLGKLVRNIQSGEPSQALQGHHIPPSLARAGQQMVQRDYVIAHIEGQPVYAKEMVPASGTGNSAVASDHSRGSGLEGSLERAIEREGERAGERRERERLLRRDGDEWERFVRRRREHEDADGLPVRSEDRKARGDDLRMVLSRADMDQLTHKLGNGAGAEKGGEAITLRAPAATAPVRYRAVHYAIPTDEYEELASGAASGSEV